MGPGSTGTIGPDGRISFAISRAEIENYVRAIRQAAQEADAAYQASLAQQREQAQREAEAEPAKRARLAQDQARIDAVLHGEAE